MRLFYWVPGLLLVSANLMAQAGIVQPCPSDALRVTFQAADGPDQRYTLAINKQNTSAETCFVDRQTHGAGFSPDLWPDGSRVKVSSPEARQTPPAEGRINLAPGDSVHQTRTWTTSPRDASTQCVTPTEMTWSTSYEWNSYIRLSSPLLLKPICSDVVNTDYTAGPFFSEGIEDTGAPRIEWDNVGEVSSRDPIALRVRVEDPNGVLVLDEHSCPRIFLLVPNVVKTAATPTHITYFDEMRNATCGIEYSGQGKQRSFVVDFDASYELAHDPIHSGEFLLNVSALTRRQGQYSLVGATKDLQLSMIDGKFIQRYWGPTIQGLAAALNLDKETYEVGDEITLHIGLENVSSPYLITSPVGMPGYVRVQIMDPGGLPIEPIAIPRSGNGAACKVFMLGEISALELKLKQLGYQLKRPGVYQAEVTWSAFKNATCGFGFPSDSNIGVASGPVTFRLAGPTAPN